jgi:hypothetical protein
VVNKRPNQDAREEAIRLALGGIASGRDIHDLSGEIAPLHRRNNTFPGEVFLELAADALQLSGATREQSVEYEGIRERYLPEFEFRSKAEHHKSHYALGAVAMVRAGIEPDLLGEVSWWNTDDFWRYAFYALVICLRIAAERTGETVATVCESIAAGAGVALWVQ